MHSHTLFHQFSLLLIFYELCTLSIVVFNHHIGCVEMGVLFTRVCIHLADDFLALENGGKKK